jgi:hypothetical protein
MPNNLSTFLVTLMMFTACGTGAASTLEVNMNTAPLIGHSAGPFSLLAVFTDGSGFADGNNSVTLDQFTFGSGYALGNPTLLGNVAGDLSAGVTAPGNQLHFRLILTDQDDPLAFPDRLTLLILDSFGSPLPTLAPAGDFFLAVDLGAAGPVVEAFASDTSRFPTVGEPISIAAPAVTVVPEPATLPIVVVTFALWILAIRDRTNASRGKRG